MYQVWHVCTHARARALKIGYFPLSLWPLCGRDFSGKRTRIPKTVSENVLPEDDFFSEDAWHPEDEFRRRIQRRWIAPRRQIEFRPGHEDASPEDGLLSEGELTPRRCILRRRFPVRKRIFFLKKSENRRLPWRRVMPRRRNPKMHFPKAKPAPKTLSEH